MFANGCFVTDGNHRFDDPDKPVPWQGFTSKGPTRIGDNVWCGANVVITSGVTIGERCVIGANSVVTTDLPPLSIAGRRAREGAADGAVPGALALVEHDGHADHDEAEEHHQRDHGERDVAAAARPSPVRRASVALPKPKIAAE